LGRALDADIGSDTRFEMDQTLGRFRAGGEWELSGSIPGAVPEQSRRRVGAGGITN